MKPFELLDETFGPAGTALKLLRRNGEFIILADGAPLMSSRTHGSEEELATLACQHLRSRNRPRVLIGGLGMGFTLRATLDLLPPGAGIVVAELIPAVIEWNRGPLGPLAGHPLQDRRTQVAASDVAALLRANSNRNQFDAILLDVDNGPAAFTWPSNSVLYNHGGIASAHSALRAGGVLAVWAVNDDLKFAQRLRQAGFAVQIHRVRARANKRGARHTIFLAHKAS